MQGVVNAADDERLIGIAFGRWDARLLPIAERGDPYDLVPTRPPAMLAGNAGDPGIPPGDYPIELPPIGVLVDAPGADWDIESAIERVASVVLADPSRFSESLLSALGAKSIRDYLRKKFFKAHLSTYSKSRRKAPIYWPLSVPSGQWGLWLYAPLLSREMLYAVASEAVLREGHAEAEITRLERERAIGGAGRSVKALTKALDSERKLAEELRRFRQEAERIAGLGWEPDLDDGIVICAAPLADLFPMWKEPAQYRKELRAGKYQWSTVSKWADKL